IAKALGDRKREADLLIGFGGVYYRSGKFQQALEAYDQARRSFASISQREGEALATKNSSAVHLALGEYQEALECLEQALQTFSELKSPLRQCEVLEGIGVTYGFMGQSRPAQESLNKAIAMAREHRLTRCEGNSLRDLGYLYIDLLDDRGKALESFNEG